MLISQQRPQLNANQLGNMLLASLPGEDVAHLQPLLQTVRLHPAQVLHRAGEAIGWVYFPITAVVALTKLLHDGGSAELGVVGHEGMAGLSAILDSASTPFDVVVQLPGTAYRMLVSAFIDTAGRAEQLGRTLQHFSLAFLGQVAQGSICRSHHDVKQRLVCYLLLLGDRVATGRLPLTHEFVARMLGVGRPSVTLTLDELQASGFVRLGRGSITLTDRRGLEATACECYCSIRDEYRRLLCQPETDGCVS
jgi:CRP-like cAMP-binding protein